MAPPTVSSPEWGVFSDGGGRSRAGSRVSCRVRRPGTRRSTVRRRSACAEKVRRSAAARIAHSCSRTPHRSRLATNNRGRRCSADLRDTRANRRCSFGKRNRAARRNRRRDRLAQRRRLPCTRRRARAWWAGLDSRRCSARERMRPAHPWPLQIRRRKGAPKGRPRRTRRHHTPRGKSGSRGTRHYRRTSRARGRKPFEDKRCRQAVRDSPSPSWGTHPRESFAYRNPMCTRSPGP